MDSISGPSSTIASGANEAQDTSPSDNTRALRDKGKGAIPAMTPKERAALLMQLAPRCELPLPELGTQSFDTPATTLDPELKAEAKALHLKRTTFCVTVWVNYDTAEQAFYGDDRLNDCGKLRLSRSGKLHLDSLDPHEHELVKVRFNISTPFHDLFTVDLTSIGNRRVRVSIEEHSTTDEYLLTFVETCCRRIKKTGIIYGTRDMTLQDLEAYATVFVR